MREGKWKLIAKRFDRPDETVELYDLQTDPGEQTDRAAAHPEVVKRLRARLVAWADEAAPAKQTADRLPPDFAVPRVWMPSSIREAAARN